MTSAQTNRCQLAIDALKAAHLMLLDDCPSGGVHPESVKLARKIVGDALKALKVRS